MATLLGVSLSSSYAHSSCLRETKLIACDTSSSSDRHSDYLKAYTPRAALRTSTGFGKRPEQKAKPKILKELEVTKVEKTETHGIFVRKVAGEEALTKWEKLGDIVIEAGASVEIALKERQSSLLAGVKHQHPVLVILGKDEALQYGVQLFQAPKESGEGENEQGSSQSDAEEIKAVDLSGKQADETVAAILRVDDGKAPGRGRRRF